MSEIEYSPQTANEAGEHIDAGVIAASDASLPPDFPAPSKPCTEPRKTPFEKVVDDLTDGCGCACHTGTGYRTSCEHCKPPNNLPCTEGGEHCFCDQSAGGVFRSAKLGERPFMCCWCGVEKLGIMQPVPGHGPYRTELVRDVS